MSLRGISLGMVSKPVPERQPAFGPGTFNVSEEVGVSLQALGELGLNVFDKEAAKASITEDFMKLSELGLAGRPFILPAENIPFDHIVAVSEGKRPTGVSEQWAYPNLWTPGTETGSFAEQELNRGPKNHSAKLAVFTSLDTHVDPTLHYRGLPVDDYARRSWNQDAPSTQDQEAAADKKAFESKNPDFTLDITDHRTFAVLVLMDRIRGTNPNSPDFILNQGWMRVPDLGRRTIDGGSVVGHIGSDDGQSVFDCESGGANVIVGLGLSVGLR